MRRLNTKFTTSVFALIVASIFFSPSPSVAAAKKEPVPLAQITLAKTRAASSTFELPTKFKKISASDAVSVTIGKYQFDFAGSSFKAGTNTKPSTYAAKKGAIGLTSIVLDPKKKTLKLVIKGVALSTERFPLPVTVKVGASASCTLLGGKKGSKTKKALKLFKTGTCPIASETLSASVNSITVNQSTPVTFALPLTRAASKMAVYSADSSGFLGKKICDLQDKGGFKYACDTTLTTRTTDALNFVAKGSAGLFPGVTIGIIKTLALTDLDSANSTVNTGIAIWESIKAQFGSTTEGRLELIQQLLAMPGVAAVTLSPNGEDVQITLTSGMNVMLILNNRGTDTGAFELDQSVTPQTRRTLEAKITALPTGSEPLKIFLFDPGYFPGSENDILRSIVKAAEPGKVAFTDITESMAKDLSVFDTLTQNDFILFVTHGSLDTSGRIGFFAPFVAGTEKTKYLSLFQAGKLMFGSAANTDQKVPQDGVLLMPNFFQDLPGQFQGSTMIGSSCYSMANSTMADVFLSKGVAGFLGFDEAVSSPFATEIAGSFMCTGLLDTKTNGESFNQFSVKTDPTIFEGHKQANVKYQGNQSAKVTSSNLFDDFKFVTEPEVLLLFFNEEDFQLTSIGSEALPPCLKYSLKNNTTNIVKNITQYNGDNEKIVFDYSDFSDGRLRYEASETAGLADISVKLTNKTTDTVMAEAFPKVEVVCKKPTIGAWSPVVTPVDIGTDAEVRPASVNATGCKLDFIIYIEQFDANSNRLEEAGCGAPKNAIPYTTAAGDSGWRIPATSLPLKLSTSSCINARSLNVEAVPIVKSNIFNDPSLFLELDSSQFKVALSPPQVGARAIEYFITSPYTPGYETFPPGSQVADATVGMRWPKSDFPGVTQFCLSVKLNSANTINYRGAVYPTEFAANSTTFENSAPHANLLSVVGTVNYNYVHLQSNLGFPAAQLFNVQSLYSSVTSWTFTVRPRPVNGCG